MSSCASKFGGNLPSSQPAVSFFRHHDCDGTRWDLPPTSGHRGNWSTYRPNGYFSNDSISSIYVPPNKRVTVYKHYDRKGGNNDRKTFGPGYYPRMSQYHFNDNISGIGIGETESWATFLLECCLGRRDPSMCKQYAGVDKSACRTKLTNYCKGSLGKFKSPACQRFGQNNKTIMDAIIPDLCKNATDDPYCACFHAPANIIRPSCFDEKCSSGKAYQTADMQNAATKCGIYCNMQFNTGGAKNVMLENNTFMQQCGDKIDTSEPTIDPETGRREYGPPRSETTSQEGTLTGSWDDPFSSRKSNIKDIDQSWWSSYGRSSDGGDDSGGDSGGFTGGSSMVPLMMGGGGSSMSSMSLLIILVVVMMAMS